MFDNVWKYFYRKKIKCKSFDVVTSEVSREKNLRCKVRRNVVRTPMVWRMWASNKNDYFNLRLCREKMCYDCTTLRPVARFSLA